MLMTFGCARQYLGFHLKEKPLQESCAENELQKNKSNVASEENPTLEKSTSKTYLGLEKTDKNQKKAPRTEEPNKADKKEKTDVIDKNAASKEDKGEKLGEKITFVLQIARRVQNWLGAVMDYADRIQS